MMKKIKSILMVVAGLIVLLLVSAVGFNSCMRSATYANEDNKLSRITSSPQYKNGKFANAVPWKEPAIRENLGTMWDFFFGKNERTPADSLPLKKVDLSHFDLTDSNQLNATWLGHSSLMINIDGYKILTDPVFEKKVSIFGPTRFNGEVPLNINELPEIDVVLISHNHYDHLNEYSILQLLDKTKRFLVPLGVGAQLEKWGVPRIKISEMDWWEEININNDLMIAATPAQHFSGRGITDRNSTLWVSFVVQSKHHNFYFSGDGGYFAGFKKIGETYGPFDMTFLECGAYNENWHHIHMFPEETVQAHLDLRGKVLHPIHLGTFNLALHSWYDPMVRVAQAARENDVNLVTPIVGETTVYPQAIATTAWWEDLLTDNIDIQQKALEK